MVTDSSRKHQAPRARCEIIAVVLFASNSRQRGDLIHGLSAEICNAFLVFLRESITSCLVTHPSCGIPVVYQKVQEPKAWFHVG